MFGRLSGLLIQALLILDERIPTSDWERKSIFRIRLLLMPLISLVRKIHHDATLRYGSM